MRYRLSALVVSLCFASLPLLAHADWPMQRHDSARTATGSSTSSIDTPAVAFRHYLGGALGMTVLVGDPLYNPFAKNPPLKESDVFSSPKGVRAFR